MQIMAVTGKLPEMRKELKLLQRKIAALENASNANANTESIRDAA